MFDIITDSACDLTPETAATLNIEIIPFYVSLDGEHYRKEGKEIAVRDFYQFMVDNPAAYPKTSLPSLEDFETAFRAHAEAGRPVLCICFTSKMSGCVGSARNARELVLEVISRSRAFSKLFWRPRATPAEKISPSLNRIMGLMPRMLAARPVTLPMRPPLMR